MNMINNKKSLDYKQILSAYGIIFALALLLIVISFMNGNFWALRNIINILRITSINGLLAIGMTFVVLTGGIDLSVGSIMGTAGMVAAFFARESIGLPAIVAVLAGLTVGLICGIINGVLISRLRVPAFVATLGMQSVASGITYIISDAKPISKLSTGFRSLGTGAILGLPIPLWIIMFVATFAFFVLYRFPFGRYVFALGGNEEATFAAGVSTNQVKFSVYLVSALLASLAGVVMTARVSSGVVTTGVGYETEAIAAVVIGGTSLAGGKGRLWGSLVGVLVLTILNNILDLLAVNSYLQLVFKGVIIICAVLIDSLSNKNK